MRTRVQLDRNRELTVKHASLWQLRTRLLQLIAWKVVQKAHRSDWLEAVSLIPFLRLA